MIKKLKRRFLLVSMCSVICVLAIIMSAVNITSYINAAKKADTLASFIADCGGTFPTTSRSAGSMPVHKPEPEPPSADGGLPEPPDADTVPRLEDYGSKHGFSPETPFETRYFTVTLSNDGAVSEINIGSISAVTTQEAEQYALELAQSSNERGYKGSYRYLVRQTQDGKMIVFVDNTRELNSFYTFLKASLLVSALGILGVFALVLLLSRRAIAPIAQAHEKQKRFITDASHELKTPLTVIDASTEVIELQYGRSDWTAGIREQVKRLTELTNSLVALARMDEADSRLVMTDFSLSDAVEEAAEPFSALALAQGKELKLQIEKNISFNGCEASLRRLVSLLLDNAIKYSSPEACITLSLKRRSRGILLSCKNPVEHMEKGAHDELFERFYRADSSRSSESGGFGIGLSQARATVEAHHGKISAFSEDGASLTISAFL